MRITRSGPSGTSASSSSSSSTAQAPFQLGNTGAESAATAGATPSFGSEAPPVYVYDTPGVMVPYLGRGARGSERGIKLAVAGKSSHQGFTHDSVSLLAKART